MPEPAFNTIQISAWFVDLTNYGSCKKFVIPFLPDSFRLPVVSRFDNKVLPLTSSQLLLYQATPPQEIEFGITLVAGIDSNIQVLNLDSNGVGTGVNDNAFNNLSVLCAELSTLTLPEKVDKMGSTIPPPKCVVRVGRMFKSVGAFTSVEFTFKGPYDGDGNPSEVDVSFRFIQSQFYDPNEAKNPTGLHIGAGKDGDKEVAGMNSNIAGSIVDAQTAGDDSKGGNSKLLNAGVASGPSAATLDGRLGSPKDFTIYAYGSGNFDKR